MLVNLAAFAITQCGAEPNYQIRARQELEMLARNRMLSLTFSDFHSRSLEFSLGTGQYISPATHLFGASNSFGISSELCLNTTVTLNTNDLSVYGIKQELLPKLSMAISAGSLVGSVISMCAGSVFLGPIGVAIGVIGLIASFYMEWFAKQQQSRLEEIMGRELTNMLAYVTNLNAIRELINVNVINIITVDEFDQAVNMQKIQESFIENFGGRTVEDEFRSLTVYANQMEELDRLLNEKKKKIPEYNEVERELSSFFGKDTTAVFSNLGYDRTSSAEINNLAYRLALLYNGPRDFRVTEISSTAGKTVVMSETIPKFSDRCYIKVETSSTDAVTFVGSLAREVNMSRLKYTDLSFMIQQQESFKKELEGIPVSGVIAISGYIGVSLCQPILMDAVSFASYSKAIIGSFSLEINSESDLYSTYKDELGQTLRVANAIKTSDSGARVSLTSSPIEPVVQLATRSGEDYALHFYSGLINLLNNEPGMSEYLESLDPVRNFALGKVENSMTRDGKFYMKFSAGLPVQIRRRPFSSVSLSLAEATFLNESLVYDEEQFRAKWPDERISTHFGIKTKIIEVSKYVREKKIRVYQGSAMAMMTTNGYPFFDTTAHLLKYNDHKYDLFLPENVSGQFSGVYKGGPQFSISLIMGEKRAWQVLE